MGASARGKQHRFRSQASKAAHNAPKSHELLKEKKFYADTSRTTFGRLKKGPKMKKRERDAALREDTAMAKGKYKKIPGTRIQADACGVHMRVIVEDGARFPANSTHSAKQHLAKLAKQKAEAEEIARMRDEAAVGIGVSPPAVPAQAAAAASADAAEGDIKASKRKRTQSKSGKAVEEKLSKKQRKQQEVEKKQKEAEDFRKGILAGRKPAGEQRFQGQIVQRGKGFATVELEVAPGSSLPGEVTKALEESDGQVRLWVFDVADKTFLKPGVRLSMRLYTDGRGVGGFDAKALAPDAADRSETA